MPRRRGQDNPIKKASSGTQREIQDEGKQRQSKREPNPAEKGDYRLQKRTGRRSTRPQSR